MKILMALMGLEIGGAETHVLELCKALAKRGHEIFVASNGGVYEKELDTVGIKHFKVPLHNKKVSSFIKSYALLKKIIIENEIKLVHAHARIPAFLCGLLQKKLDFKFVTTAHWIFKTSFPFNVLTNWGEKTLAVSDDIKNYLIKSYKLDEKNITVTINGIDTEKFSQDINYDDILQEFGFDKNKKYIVCVSRLDKDRSLCAHKLLEIAADICKENVELIIVGGGNDESELKKKAELINKKVARKIIHLVGARVDINKFLALSNIFVGVSRAALEAMAAKKPVILAGNEGYIGIFDEDKLQRAIQTNFCCRECENISCAKLKSDIKKLLNLDKKSLQKFGDYGFDIIKKYYSVEKMADDAISVYESVRYLPKNILISGYYGFNNNGDDSVLKSIVDDLKKIEPEIKITVLSKRPLETSKLYGVNSLYRFNFFAIKKFIRQTNLLISGGGSLIQDVTSTHSLKYYLWIINLALKNSVRVMLYSNGIGPILREKNRILAANILNKVDLITLRDKNSADELKKLCVDKPPIIVTADAAFNLNLPQTSALLKFNITENFFVIALRSWKYNAEAFEKNIAVFADYIQQKYNLLPVFVPMHPTNDVKISKKIISLMKSTAKYICDYTTNDLINLIAKAEFVFGMRLHTIIYAVQTSTPVLALIYDPKVKAIMDETNQFTYMDVSQLNLKKLKDFASDILMNRNKISEQIKNCADVLKQNSAQNTKLALELLNKPIF